MYVFSFTIHRQCKTKVEIKSATHYILSKAPINLWPTLKQSHEQYLGELSHYILTTNTTLQRFGYRDEIHTKDYLDKNIFMEQDIRKSHRT